MKVLPLFAILAFTISAGAQTATGNAASDVTTPQSSVSQSAAAAATRSGMNETGSAAAQSRHIAGSAAEAGNISRSATTTSSSLNEASAAAARSGHLAGSASQATDLSAELTRNIDSKHAHVGDLVEAKTTSKALLADGTRLPKGTHLIGHVTEVSRETKANKTSHLAFAFDHAVLRNGNEIPIHAVLRSLSARAPMVNADGDVAGDAAMNTPIMAGGGAARGRGGLLGGGGGVVGGGSALAGGALRSGGNVAGGAVNTVGRTTAGASAETMGDMNAAARAGNRNLAGNLGAGAGTSAQGQLIPVGNLRGVSFSSNSDANSSAMFQGQGRNVSLSSGSTMSLAVSAEK